MVYISEKESLSDPAAVQVNNKSANKEKQITFHFFFYPMCLLVRSIEKHWFVWSVLLSTKENLSWSVLHVFFFYQLRKFCQRENVVFSIKLISCHSLTHFEKKGGGMVGLLVAHWPQVTIPPPIFQSEYVTHWTSTSKVLQRSECGNLPFKPLLESPTNFIMFPCEKTTCHIERRNFRNLKKERKLRIWFNKVLWRVREHHLLFFQGWFPWMLPVKPVVCLVWGWLKWKQRKMEAREEMRAKLRGEKRSQGKEGKWSGITSIEQSSIPAFYCTQSCGVCWSLNQVP